MGLKMPIVGKVIRRTWVAILNRMNNIDLIKEVRFEQGLEGSERANHIEIEDKEEEIPRARS